MGSFNIFAILVFGTIKNIYRRTTRVPLRKHTTSQMKHIDSHSQIKTTTQMNFTVYNRWNCHSRLLDPPATAAKRNLSIFNLKLINCNYRFTLFTTSNKTWCCFFLLFLLRVVVIFNIVAIIRKKKKKLQQKEMDTKGKVGICYT